MKTMRRRHWPLWLLCGLLLGLVSACTRTPQSQDFKGQSVKLRFMFWGDPAEVRTVRYSINLFEKQTPGVSVELIHQPSAVYRDNLRIRMIGNDAPDVMYMGLEDFAGFAKDGHLAPLDEFMSADKDFDSQRYYQEIIQQFRRDGQCWGLAKDFATLVLYYNKDLFDKWEVPYPKAGWTWDEFLETAKKLTHRQVEVLDGSGKRQDEYGIVLETWTGQWLPWVWQNGGRVIDEDKPEWLLGDPRYLDQNAEALQFMADLIWKHEVAPNPSYTRNQGTSDVFKGGRAAMYTAGRWMCMQFAEIKGFDWDVVTLPRGKKRATCLFTAALSISKQSQHKQAAWALVKFLTSERCQQETANAGLAIPILKSVADSKAFTAPRAFPKGLSINSEANLADIPYAKAPPRLSVWPEVRTRLSEGLQSVFNNRRTAREALIAMQKPLNKIIQRAAKDAPKKSQ